MKMKLMAGVAAAILACGLAGADTEDGYVTPKTAWGAPDFQGFWNNTSVTSLSRPRGVDKLTVTEDEAKAIVDQNAFQILLREDAATNGQDPNNTDILEDKNADRGYNGFWVDAGSRLATVKGEYRTSWITEPSTGQVPYTKAAMDARMARYRSGGDRWDGPEARGLAERCLMSFTGSAGPVMTNGMYNNTFQFVQAPDAVMINIEMIHDTRVIPIVANAAEAHHGPDVIKKWAGDSVGWYEGDTLVVETVNPNPEQSALISDEGKVTERFTRWSPDEIFYEFTVEDPSMYTQTWKGEMALRYSDERLYEYACHEGNYAMPGILAGARKIEAEGGKPSSGPGITAGIVVPPAE